MSQRHETEHEPGEQDRDEGHGQQPQVQRRGDGAAQGVRDQRLQHVECSRGQQQSNDRTTGGQQQAFHEQLTQQLDSTAAERGADREFTIAFRAARHEQASHVRAGDQQDQHRGRQQEQERRPGVASQILLKRNGKGRGIGVLRIGLRQCPGDGFEFRVRVFDGHIRLQTTNDSTGRMCYATEHPSPRECRRASRPGCPRGETGSHEA